MGYYVNLPTETKEAFLASHGTPTSQNIRWEEVPEGSLPVLLVDNGAFTAAAILYSKKELDTSKKSRTGDRERCIS
jgi:hypothetical protein